MNTMKDVLLEGLKEDVRLDEGYKFLPNAFDVDLDADQYFTKWSVSSKCWDIFKAVVGEGTLNDSILVEPSMGKGSFFFQLPAHNRVGFDWEPKVVGQGIYPKHQDMIKLTRNKVYKVAGYKAPIIFVGNPPYNYPDKKGNGIIKDFLKVAHKMGVKYLGLLIPTKFWDSSSFYHKISVTRFEDNSFILPDGKDYNVPGTSFTIFELKDTKVGPVPKTPCPYVTFTPRGNYDGIVITPRGRGDTMGLDGAIQKGSFAINGQGITNKLLRAAFRKQQEEIIRLSSEGYLMNAITQENIRKGLAPVLRIIQKLGDDDILNKLSECMNDDQLVELITDIIRNKG